MTPLQPSPKSRIPRRQFLTTAGSLAGALMVPLGDLSAQEKAVSPAAAHETSPRKVKIAAIALATLDGMLESNYARALRMAEISLQYKPEIILLPEAFAAGYGGQPLAQYAEEVAKSEHLADFRRLSARTVA